MIGGSSANIGNNQGMNAGNDEDENENYIDGDKQNDDVLPP